MPLILSLAQTKVLTALVDTFVPSIDVSDDSSGFFSTAGTQVGADRGVAFYLENRVSRTDRAGLISLLDVFDEAGLVDSIPAGREEIIAAVESSSPQALVGVGVLRNLSIMFSYAMTDATGSNPFWNEFGYPGQPPRPIAARGRTLTTVVPQVGDQLHYDAVIVGSGAGGGVVAAELSAAGLRVLVVEKGGYFTEQDFPATEFNAYSLYRRGGPAPTADGMVACITGSAVGGSTTIAWSNSPVLPDRIRRRWAEEFGLADIDTPEFDEHLAIVLDRLKVNTDVADQNIAHSLLSGAAAQLGWSYERAALNLDPDRYDQNRAGFTTFGDQSGAKQGSLLTWLQDASDRGAALMSNTEVTRVIVENGRATGVEGIYNGPDSVSPSPVTVFAPLIVVAAGSLDTPALLLRSGIGGPAVGKTLHLHPGPVVSGEYPTPVDPWQGPAQAGIMTEFSEPDNGFGFIVENFHHLPGFATSLVPWLDGRSHKELASRYQYRADWIGMVHDRGNGSVEIDDDDRSRALYPFSDPVDRTNYYAATEAIVRLHHAAGAVVIYSAGQRFAPWRRGDDLEAYIERLRKTPIGPSGLAAGSAHQMGSAPMGRDPQTSVADVHGQLHDTAGVWIADASAMPTASSINPMVTIMALARRTAHRIIKSSQNSSLAAYPRTAPGESHEIARTPNPSGV